MIYLGVLAFAGLTYGLPAIEDDARQRLLEEQRAKLAEQSKSGGVSAEVLAQVVKAAYDIDVPINDGAPPPKGVSVETRQAIRETLGIA